MTSLQTETYALTIMRDKHTCIKCGSAVQYRRIVIKGERVGIWQCRVCRFYVFDEPFDE